MQLPTSMPICTLCISGVLVASVLGGSSLGVSQLLEPHSLQGSDLGRVEYRAVLSQGSGLEGRLGSSRSRVALGLGREVGLLVIGRLGLVLHRGRPVAGAGGEGRRAGLGRRLGLVGEAGARSRLVLGRVRRAGLGALLPVLGGAGRRPGKLGEVGGLGLSDLGRVDHRAVLADRGRRSAVGGGAWGTGVAGRARAVLGLARRYQAGEEDLKVELIGIKLGCVVRYGLIESCAVDIIYYGECQ